MRIAFVTTYDARDPSVWAGSTYHMAKALERQGLELHYVGPLREHRRLVNKARQIAYQRLRGLDLHRDREPAVLDGYARQVERALRDEQVDLVFSPGSVPVAHLRTDLPVVFWTDATYDAVAHEYVYPPPPPPCARSLRLGHAMEARALRNCALAVFTSLWAARSAVEDFGADPAKVKVVPFGANIDVQRTAELVHRMIDARPRDRCNLLHIGVGWQRKGGDVSVEVARRLSAGGLETRLTMLGSRPPDGFAVPAFVNPLGFIDKRTSAGRRRFDELFGSSHFLLLPARAEAFGVVLCEACSFGVPCLASRAGGIPSVVSDDVNGKLFDRGADPARYADYVASHFADFERYRALARSAFAEYETTLNWDVAARRVTELLEQVVRATRAPAGGDPRPLTGG
jgi:glycosyltransferase involved in cell wall biosynthesis